ncbi:MAG: mono/diheme cytochrome c family protein [Myxococcota bacterium]
MRTLAVAAVLVVTACGSTEPSLTFDTNVDAEQLASGEELYALHCAECHDDDGRGTSEGPDLTVRLQTLTPAEVAAVVVLGDGRMEPVDVTNDEAFIVSVWVVEMFGAESR